MLRYKLLALLVACCYLSAAQELFVYSEPASNMPTRTLGLRLTNWTMQQDGTQKWNEHFFPEIMIGISKQVMIHVDAIYSNRAGNMAVEGAGLYMKYRFLSHDDMHRHFRMAAFGRLTTNNSDLHQEELSTYGHNSGYQAGLIATQLLHKLALSSTAYYEHALNGKLTEVRDPSSPGQAINISCSAGRLILPKSYKTYSQVNLNVMLEVLGQHLLSTGHHYLDVAPSIQLIFNSQTRFDVGYRHQIISDMVRTAPNGLLLRLEHLLYRVF